jgi:hypothetical protein
MKGGYVWLGFQPINIIINDLNQLNKFLMFLFNYKPKKNAGLLRYFQNDILSFGVPKPYKNIK